jgi:hypothetical protein
MSKLYTAFSIILVCLFFSVYTYGGYVVSAPLKVSTTRQYLPENNWHNSISNSAKLNFNIQDTTAKIPTKSKPKRAKEENWQAGTSVIIGIAGWMSTLLSGVFGIYFLLSIPAIILGIKGLKRYKKRKYLAVLGLVLGFTLGLFLLFATLNISPIIV